MGHKVDTALERSVRALTERDERLAHDVIEGDKDINALFGRIEHDALELLATQGPMAGDLRHILAVSAIATDLERIGDHAKHIAGVTVEVHDAACGESLVDIERMTDLSRELLLAVLKTVPVRDERAARAVADRDREIDALYDRVARRIVNKMMDDPESIPTLERVLLIAKRLERVGDHVTNIGERIVFLTTGEVVELNP